MHTLSEEDTTMKALHLGLLLVVALAPACAVTTTTRTTWTDPAAAANGRAGRVEAVQEIVQRTEGNPAGGAVAGGLIGGLVFGGGRGPAAVAGAAGGAAVGAAASQGTTERRDYQVVVRFDDGGVGEFVYAGYSPFRPGERVAVTPGGLTRAG
jgi:outer membrane lipoprotein SlyB